MIYLPVDAVLVHTPTLLFRDANLSAEDFSRGTDASLSQSAVGALPSSVQVGAGRGTSPDRGPVDHARGTLLACSKRGALAIRTWSISYQESLKFNEGCCSMSVECFRLYAYFCCFSHLSKLVFIFFFVFQHLLN